jgi:hypothetical protein
MLDYLRYVTSTRHILVLGTLVRRIVCHSWLYLYALSFLQTLIMQAVPRQSHSATSWSWDRLAGKA